MIGERKEGDKNENVKAFASVRVDRNLIIAHEWAWLMNSWHTKVDFPRLSTDYIFSLTLIKINLDTSIRKKISKQRAMKSKNGRKWAEWAVKIFFLISICN